MKNKEEYFLQYGKKKNGRIVCNEEVNLTEFFIELRKDYNRILRDSLSGLGFWGKLFHKKRMIERHAVLVDALHCLENEFAVRILFDELHTKKKKSKKKE